MNKEKQDNIPARYTNEAVDLTENSAKNQPLIIGIAIVILLIFIALGFFWSAKKQATTIDDPKTDKPSFEGPVPGSKIINGPNFANSWQSVLIKASNFPDNSWYRVVRSNKEQFVINFFPYIKDSNILEPTDVILSVAITKTDRRETALGCVSPVGFDDVRDENLKTSNLDIIVSHSLNYNYDGGPLSNPSPYDKNLKELLLEIIKSIEVGDCN